MTNGVNAKVALRGLPKVVAKLMTALVYPTSVEEMNRRLEEILADPSCCTLVAESDGQVLGMQASTSSASTRKTRRALGLWR